MIRIPREVHKALATLFKYKLISEIERQQLMEKSMRRDPGGELIQMASSIRTPVPRGATAALARTLKDIIDRSSNDTFTVSDMHAKAVETLGNTSDSSVRYSLEMIARQGHIETTRIDGRVIFAKKKGNNV